MVHKLYSISLFRSALEMFQVALKRQQAAEDAIALGLRMQHSDSSTEMPKLGFLAPGPVFPSQGELAVV